MFHRKGNRKNIAAENRGRPIHHQQSQAINAGDIKIKTRNCVDHDKIKSNILENLSQIRAWATICGYNEGGEVAICSAGPSLSNHIEEIRDLQNRGVKIVAVKHAIETLRRHGIKPWAVVLLDPRGHVEGFVKKPDTDAIYFVASMCDPSVVKALNQNNCNVIGYHAFVGAGETDLFITSDLPVSGGSATSTRSIGLFSDMFGIKKFHLFGVDLCHYQKPDMNEKDTEGRPKYMEITIGTQGYGGKQFNRTFWTEGQFLAQSNELQDLYKTRKDIKIVIYGDGIAGWLYKNYQAYKKFQAEYNERLDSIRSGAPTLEEFICAVTRGTELSRRSK
jgi:hypothetical protein